MKIHYILKEKTSLRPLASKTKLKEVILCSLKTTDEVFWGFVLMLLLCVVPFSLDSIQRSESSKILAQYKYHGEMLSLQK